VLCSIQYATIATEMYFEHFLRRQAAYWILFGATNQQHNSVRVWPWIY